MNDETKRNRWLIPLFVAVFGCLGGLTAWVWLYATGEWQDNGIGVAIATNMFLGAVAGFIGVYALKVDSPRFVPHTLALALLCGFAWKPTLEAGREYVATQTAEAEAKVQQQYAKERIELLKDADPEMAPELIRDLESVSQELMESEVAIRDPRLRLELNSVVAHSVEAISEAAQFAPRDSAQALISVEEAAVARGNMRVSRSARNRLENVDDGRELEALEERRRLEALEERRRQRPEKPE